MTVFEIDEALDGMVCLADSREQDTPRLRARLAQMNCPNEREKLNFGDYSAKFPLQSGKWFSLEKLVSIERKQNIDELCNCYCKDRQRFIREFERSAENGSKIYLLIEDATWEKIYAGKYQSKMRETALVASILAWLARYNCQVIFCKAETSGQLIKDILYREGKERMERGEADELCTATPQV